MLLAERADHDEDQHAQGMPPFEAWKDPGAWLTLDGRVKPGIDKFQVPTVDGFIDIDALMQRVLVELFHPEYQWLFDKNDVRTRPDNHHFYYDEEMYRPEHHNGNKIPYQFRNLPVLVGRMPRLFHNVLHAVVERPEMPEMDAMEEYVDAYLVAHAAFKRLFLTAKQTVSASQMFAVRRSAVEQKVVIPRTEDDADVERYLMEFFRKHFSSYSDAIDAFNETKGKEIVYQEYQNVKVTRPRVVVQKLGHVVSRKSFQVNLGMFDIAA